MIRDVRLDGMGSIDGGEYANVSVDGMGKVRGDLACASLNINGKARLLGQVAAQEFVCNGMATCRRQLRAKEIRVSGLLKASREGVQADRIDCDGMISCDGEVTADQIRIAGGCTVASMTGDILHIHASPQITLQGAGRPLAGILLGRRLGDTPATVDHIECTELYADWLTAKTVRAQRVVLGEHCAIGALEYGETLSYGKTCTIGQILATGPDAGEAAGSEQPAKEEQTMDATAILRSFKAGQLNEEEAKQLLDALYRTDAPAAQPPEPAAVAGIPDDDTLRIVAMRGNRLLEQREWQQQRIQLEVGYQGNARNVECWGNLNCQDVTGNVNAGLSVSCADVGGGVTAGTSVACGDVNGSVSAGTHITCAAVAGSANAGAYIKYT